MRTEIWPEILNHYRIGYGLFTADGRLSSCSPLFLELLPSVVCRAEFAAGAALLDLLPELAGMEEAIWHPAPGETPEVRLEWIHTSRPDSYPPCRAQFVSLAVLSTPDRLLALLQDATETGHLFQTIQQQRNEVQLLSAELEKARLKLDETLRRLVASAVVDHSLAARQAPAPGGQVREVTVLFGDLRGYSTWADRQPPEAVFARLNWLYERCAAILQRYAVAINQYMGDGFMVLFNAPAAQTGHPHLALQCANELAAIRLEDQTHSLGIGVHTGPAIVGYVGAASRLDYSAIGTTTNIAYRLQTLARAGEVLFSQRVLESGGAALPHEFVDQVSVKGIAGPLQVYRLVTGRPGEQSASVNP